MVQLVACERIQLQTQALIEPTAPTDSVAFWPMIVHVISNIFVCPLCGRNNFVGASSLKIIYHAILTICNTDLHTLLLASCWQQWPCNICSSLTELIHRYFWWQSKNCDIFLIYVTFQVDSNVSNVDTDTSCKAKLKFSMEIQKNTLIYANVS